MSRERGKVFDRKGPTKERLTEKIVNTWLQVDTEGLLCVQDDARS